MEPPATPRPAQLLLLHFTLILFTVQIWVSLSCMCTTVFLHFTGCKHNRFHLRKIMCCTSVQSLSYRSKLLAVLYQTYVINNHTQLWINVIRKRSSKHSSTWGARSMAADGVTVRNLADISVCLLFDRPTSFINESAKWCKVQSLTPPPVVWLQETLHTNTGQYWSILINTNMSACHSHTQHVW